MSDDFNTKRSLTGLNLLRVIANHAGVGCVPVYSTNSATGCRAFNVTLPNNKYNAKLWWFDSDPENFTISIEGQGTARYPARWEFAESLLREVDPVQKTTEKMSDGVDPINGYLRHYFSELMRLGFHADIMENSVGVVERLSSNAMNDIVNQTLKDMMPELERLVDDVEIIRSMS